MLNVVTSSNKILIIEISFHSSLYHLFGLLFFFFKLGYSFNREGNGTPLQDSCLENPMDGEPGRLQFMGSLESDTTERLHFPFSLSCIAEGNGTPLQCSCLENPRDGKPGGLPSVGSHRVGHD